MSRWRNILLTIRAIATLLWPAIVVMAVLAVFFLIFAIRKDKHLSDIANALKNTSSYYISIRQDDVVSGAPEMNSSTLLYEGYVKNMESSAMLKTNGSGIYNQIIIGDTIYENLDGLWEEHKGGFGMINNLNSAVVNLNSEETFRSAGITVLDNTATHTYTYSNTPKNMFGPAIRSVYYLNDDTVPIRVLHDTAYEMGSTRTTIEISRINEPITITAPDINQNNKLLR